MNWFEVIKENRLATETITHTKVSDEKRSEPEERRCRDSLKRKMGYLKTLHRHLEMSYNKPHPSDRDYRVSNLYGTHYRKRIPEPYDHAIKELDKIPEEVCCALLENIQNVVQKGKAHVNANKDKNTYVSGNNDLNFYDETEDIVVDNAEWDTKCEIYVITSDKLIGSDIPNDPDYSVLLWLSARDSFEPSTLYGEYRRPFVEMDIHYPSRWNEDFDKKNPPLDTRWDLLNSVVEALGLG